MLKELDKVNTTSSKTIYVSRILILLVLSLLINKSSIYFLSIIFLLIFNYKESVIYAIIICFILLIDSINYAYIPVGIVEKKVNNYYVLDSLIYKTKITIDDIEVGDIIFYTEYETINDQSYLKKNIRYSITKYKKICTFSLRNKIYERISNFDENTKTILFKFLYNITNYDDLTYNLGYGFALYYLLKFIYSKNKEISLIISIIYAFIFYLDVKLYLLYIDFILDLFKCKNKIIIKAILILIINRYFIYNYAIIIPILISLYRYMNVNINFKMYLSIIESTFFGYINLLSILAFKYLIIIQCFIFIICMFTLFIPDMSILLKEIINLYDRFNNIDLSIRGSLNVISISLYILIQKLFNIKNKEIKYILLLLILFLTIFNPFIYVTYIDVGQGDSCLIHLPLNKGNVLIDTGSKYNYYKLKKYLYSKGIYEIDYLVLTHDDSDHNGNVDSLNNDFKISNIVVNPVDIKIDNLLLKNLYIGEFDNDNDSSLVYWMNIDDISFLFTGDISKTAEIKLIKEYGHIDVDILKISHHGSKTGSSEQFIANTLPDISIISTSGQYNHPSNEVIERLDRYLSKTFITKQNGNLEIYMSKLISLLISSKGDFVIIK